MIQRKNIWDADTVFHCPVAGFCLTEKEQKNIVQKFVAKRNYRLVLPKLHDFIIGCISAESEMSRFIQKLIDKKYSKQIAHFYSVENLLDREKYTQYFNHEYFAAFIWFVAVHADLGEREYNMLNRDIHDYSHNMYHELCSVSKEFDEVCEEYDFLEERYESLRKSFRQKERENRHLRDKIKALTTRNCLLRKQLDNSSVYQNKVNGMQGIIGELEITIQEKEFMINQLKSENKKIIKLQKSQFSLFCEFQEDFSGFINQLQENQEKECNSCEKVDLCNQRVLIVGGISKINSFYKKLITQLGGEFIYHDGYCKQDERQLADLVNKSDIVICPVDVNSHAACLSVKKACKKSGKDYYMLRKSSISSVYNTLVNIQHVG